MTFISPLPDYLVIFSDCHKAPKSGRPWNILMEQNNLELETFRHFQAYKFLFVNPLSHSTVRGQLLSIKSIENCRHSDVTNAAHGEVIRHKGVSTPRLIILIETCHI